VGVGLGGVLLIFGGGYGLGLDDGVVVDCGFCGGWCVVSVSWRGVGVGGGCWYCLGGMVGVDGFWCVGWGAWC